MIYLDSAATTPTDAETFKKMSPYFCEVYGNADSPHAIGRAAAEAVVSARDKTAQILGCSPQDVYFTSGGAEGANWAVRGALAKSKKRHVLISAIEHAATLESAIYMRKFGFEVEFIPVGSSGAADPDAVKKMLRPDTAFCAVMAVNNETGVIQPTREIYDICRENEVFFFSDCVQAAPYFTPDVNSADMLTLSAHKFFGPKGAGAAYLNPRAQIDPVISGGFQERSRRGGTTFVAGAVGLALSLAAAHKNYAANNLYVKGLRDKFCSLVLGGISGAHLNGGGDKIPSITNISFDGCEGSNIVFCLDLNGVCASAGAACSAGAAKPSRVIEAMLGAERAKSAVRFSFSKLNTVEEVEKAYSVLSEVVTRIREK